MGNCGRGVLWGVVSKLQGKFVLTWEQLGLLIALALVSATARTWVGLKDPRVMYRLTLPLVMFDLLLITLATRFTGGFESQVWLLYFALLTSEAVVMSTSLLLGALGLMAVGYGWASTPLPPDLWNDFVFRIASVGLVSWLIHQVYRSHAEYRLELAELREQYELAQERERIAREFHDGLGHHLVSAIRGLEALQRQLESSACGANGMLPDRLPALTNGALQEQITSCVPRWTTHAKLSSSCTHQRLPTCVFLFVRRRRVWRIGSAHNSTACVLTRCLS
ncbi:MAG: histidine kinase [Fimbriimonadales bacterium]